MLDLRLHVSLKLPEIVKTNLPLLLIKLEYALVDRILDKLILLFLRAAPTSLLTGEVFFKQFLSDGLQNIFFPPLR